MVLSYGLQRLRFVLLVAGLDAGSQYVGPEHRILHKQYPYSQLSGVRLVRLGYNMMAFVTHIND